MISTLQYTWSWFSFKHKSGLTLTRMVGPRFNFKSDLILYLRADI